MSTYNKFLTNQSVKFQNEALGEKNAQNFRTGKLSVTKFIERKNAPMTLAELEDSHELSLTNPED